MIFVTHRWRAINRGLWASPKDCLATVGAVVAIVSTVAGGVAAIVGALT
ncbi:hypothetical protein SAMN05421678_11824 [Actinopolymorpha cephalotaxi]|uniref:Uncharacterized protein n=1 Tax=Actinopolymorpha cephalotaxi TaxID=504797 RepID=A0A1I3A4D5_9ACTN|nr:hypothetical protein [Actinopolymorpha cephalotaxi]SFH44619.1 hypothetical protein SAMN05421678_11824 [Actinopolymorpha cephalotaxi]